MFARIRRDWSEMSTARKIRRVIAIALVIFGIWALSPSFYNLRVDEAFPAAPAAPTAAMAAPTAAPAAPTAAMAEPTAAMAEPTAATAPVGPVVFRRGTFVAGSFPGDRAEGTATIYRLENGQRVLRLEGFSSTNGPDLFVTLHTGANPEKDAGKHLPIAKLKGNIGDQNYGLPAELDLSAYRSVVIWCRAFNIVFGYATLADAEPR
jgi:hypothetical protein